MKLLGKAASLIVSVALVCLPVLPIYAAQTYRVEKLTLPENLPEDFGNRGILVQDDGSIDVFTFLWEKEKIEDQFYHLHSPDGGKTWKQQGISWYTDCAKKYVDPKDKENMMSFDPIHMKTDGKGTFYFLAMTGIKDFETGAYSAANTEIYSVFKLSKGVATPIVTFDQEIGKQRAFGYPVMLDYSNGKLAVALEVGLGAMIDDYNFLLLNPDTGDIQYQHLFQGASGMVPEAYWNGKIYGRNCVKEGTINDVKRRLGRDTDKKLWLVFDTATGKEIQKVDSVAYGGTTDSDYDYQYSLAVDRQGTAYFTSSHGLYRLKAGESAFTKLMEASASGLGETRWAMHTGSGDKGDFYAVTCSNEESNLGKAPEILHYIPA